MFRIQSYNEDERLHCASPCVKWTDRLSPTLPPLVKSYTTSIRQRPFFPFKYHELTTSLEPQSLNEQIVSLFRLLTRTCGQINGGGGSPSNQFFFFFFLNLSKGGEREREGLCRSSVLHVSLMLRPCQALSYSCLGTIERYIRLFL